MPVGHPDEVDEIFDAISYSKGASVIRMLHDYIGDEVRHLRIRNKYILVLLIFSVPKALNWMNVVIL